MTSGGAPVRGIGELAAAAGVTVRTLHHYDRLGLLRPSRRTAAGHRRYTAADVRRLARILLLRQLGMGLSEIADVLGDPELLAAVLAEHLASLERRQRRLAELRARTQLLVDQLTGDGPDPDALLDTLGHVTTIGQYLTGPQRDALASRVDELGGDAGIRLEVELPMTIARLAEHHRAGDPVDSPAVQRATALLFELAELFTGDRPDVRAAMLSFFRRYGPRPGTSPAAPAPADPSDRTEPPAPTEPLDRAGASEPTGTSDPTEPPDRAGASEALPGNGFLDYLDRAHAIWRRSAT